MKKIKAINGYTIYQATARDVDKYNVDEGYFYLFFSSDIRDYGLSNSDWDYEAGSIEEAESFASGTNYAIAKEIVEETTTAASFEEIQAVEAMLDNGMSREEIEDPMTIHIDLSNYAPVESESFRIEYWYNRYTRDWVVQVYDNNDIEQECQYCPDKPSRDHEIEYLSSKYDTTDIKKF